MAVSVKKVVSIKQKIITLVIAVAILASLGALGLSIKNIKSQLLHENVSKIETITQVVYDILSTYKHRVDAKELSLEQAQKMALQDVRAIRYEGENYVWINNYDNMMLVHPIKEGHDISTISDKNGIKFFYDGSNIAKAKGIGTVEYHWVKNGQDPSKVYPKISFFRSFPDWGWVIGTGVYIDEIDSILLNVSLQILIGTIVLTGIIIVGVLFTIVKDLVSSLTNITEGIGSSSDFITSASNQLKTTSLKLAEATTEQAAAIQETSATLEETTSMVRQNNQNTIEAAKLAKQSKDCADTSSEGMTEMLGAMTEIKKSSDEISKIIKVIDDIAFQTNILALNAAVEAARAGDAGKGFAVVAEEVRNLAQRSAQAAKDTTNIIESNIGLSDKGASIAKTVSESINEINTQSKKVSELLDEISVATNEQSQGVDQIRQAVLQIESVLQSNAHNADQSAMASEELLNQTTNMNDMISKLTEIVSGSNEDYVRQSYKPSQIETRKPQERRLAAASTKKIPTLKKSDFYKKTESAKPAETPKKIDTVKKKVESSEIRPEDIIPLGDDF